MGAAHIQGGVAGVSDTCIQLFREGAVHTWGAELALWKLIPAVCLWTALCLTTYSFSSTGAHSVRVFADVPLCCLLLALRTPKVK